MGSSSFVARTCAHHPWTAKSKVGHVKSKRDPSKVRTGAISARKLPACWHLDRIVKCRTERSFGIRSQLHFAARMRVRESASQHRAKAIACSALKDYIRESQSFSLEEGIGSHVIRSCDCPKKSTADQPHMCDEHRRQQMLLMLLRSADYHLELPCTNEAP